MALNFNSPVQGSPVRTLSFGSPLIGSPARNLFGSPAGFRPTLGPKKADLGVMPWGSPGTPTLREQIGAGSYGTVYRAKTPQGDVAVKCTGVNTKHTKNLSGQDGNQPLTVEDARRELNFVNSPGAVPGVAMQSYDETTPLKNVALVVMPLCVPVTPADLPQILEVIQVADEHLVFDVKPENVMKAPVGALIPTKLNGAIVYHPTQVEQVFITDLTYTPDQESGDARWCPLDEVPDIRAFKRRMMEEWAKNPEEDANVRRERVEAEFH